MILEPGTTQSVPFSIITIGGGGNFTVQASNDQNFSLTSSSSLNLDVGGSANGTVNITAPADASSGTGVTLTIQAVAPGGADTNYAVLRFTVLEKVPLVTLVLSRFNVLLRVKVTVFIDYFSQLHPLV